MSDEYGPIEFVVIVIPDDGALPGILAAVGNQIDAGSVRLLDAVVIDRTEDGDLRFAEITERANLGTLVLAAEGITSDEDALHLAAALPAGASALLLTVESVWLKRLAAGVESAGGDLIQADRVPAAIVNAVATALS